MVPQGGKDHLRTPSSWARPSPPLRQVCCRISRERKRRDAAPLWLAQSECRDRHMSIWIYHRTHSQTPSSGCGGVLQLSGFRMPLHGTGCKHTMPAMHSQLSAHAMQATAEQHSSHGGGSGPGSSITREPASTAAGRQASRPLHSAGALTHSGPTARLTARRAASDHRARLQRLLRDARRSLAPFQQSLKALLQACSMASRRGAQDRSERRVARRPAACRQFAAFSGTG